MDDLPDKTEDLKLFKNQLMGLSDVYYQVKVQNIFEVNSAKHPILQAIDIVLGSMQFRLNNLHLVKPEGQRCRGKRTIAKEKLYRHILGHIRSKALRMEGFNIGVTTGDWGRSMREWELPYAHRSYFLAEEKSLNLSRGKRYRLRQK
ncbi:hypothetical protein FAI40_04240 [Acetobacteraceae bacterium]|nr:hypothetical protein FAI40_04240 [Acetobacteraceae bacterium]